MRLTNLMCSAPLTTDHTHASCSQSQDSHSMTIYSWSESRQKGFKSSGPAHTKTDPTVGERSSHAAPPLSPGTRPVLTWPLHLASCLSSLVCFYSTPVWLYSGVASCYSASTSASSPHPNHASRRARTPHRRPRPISAGQPRRPRVLHRRFSYLIFVAHAQYHSHAVHASNHTPSPSSASSPPSPTPPPTIIAYYGKLSSCTNHHRNSLGSSSSHPPAASSSCSTNDHVSALHRRRLRSVPRPPPASP